MKPEEALTKSIDTAQAMRMAPNAPVAAAPSCQASLRPSNRVAMPGIVIWLLPETP